MICIWQKIKNIHIEHNTKGIDSINEMSWFRFFGKVLLVYIIDDVCIVHNEDDYKCKYERALDPNSPQRLVISPVRYYRASIDYLSLI
jgi:hypothetical protein